VASPKNAYALHQQHSDHHHRHTKQVATSTAHTVTKQMGFEYRLRVCNAYPYQAAIDIYHKNTQLTKDAPLPYKHCKDFESRLAMGDKIEFTVDDTNAGTFSVAELPPHDAVLLLVIYRHDTLSTAVSFEPHVYANLLNAQIAIIDTYKGSAKARLSIDDHPDSKSSRSEELRFDSVVAVNEGRYRAVLSSEGGEEIASAPIVCLNKESYVILRVGVESQSGKSYPQELVVYPMSDPYYLSGAFSSKALSAVSSLLLAIFIAIQLT